MSDTEQPESSRQAQQRAAARPRETVLLPPPDVQNQLLALLQQYGVDLLVPWCKQLDCQLQNFATGHPAVSTTSPDQCSADVSSRGQGKRRRSHTPPNPRYPRSETSVCPKCDRCKSWKELARHIRETHVTLGKKICPDCKGHFQITRPDKYKKHDCHLACDNKKCDHWKRLQIDTLEASVALGCGLCQYVVPVKDKNSVIAFANHVYHKHTEAVQNWDLETNIANLLRIGTIADCWRDLVPGLRPGTEAWSSVNWNETALRQVIEFLEHPHQQSMVSNGWSEMKAIITEFQQQNDLPQRFFLSSDGPEHPNPMAAPHQPQAAAHDLDIDAAPLAPGASLAEPYSLHTPGRRMRNQAGLLPHRQVLGGMLEDSNRPSLPQSHQSNAPRNATPPGTQLLTTPDGNGDLTDYTNGALWVAQEQQRMQNGDPLQHFDYCIDPMLINPNP